MFGTGPSTTARSRPVWVGPGTKKRFFSSYPGDDLAGDCFLDLLASDTVLGGMLNVPLVPDKALDYRRFLEWCHTLHAIVIHRMLPMVIWKEGEACANLGSATV